MTTQTKLYAGYSIGPDCYQEADRYCRPYGTRILLIGGKTGMAKGEPLLRQALAASNSGLKIVASAIYGTDCTYRRIHELRDEYKDQNIHMVFGMGGGKAVDTAKGTAAELGVPVFTFPTIASNCASMAALSVVYREDNSFDSFYFFERPAVHCFMNTLVMLRAPGQYLRAGMGDTIAKYFECHFSARGDTLDFHSALGREISNLCYERIHNYAKAALKEQAEGVPGPAFTQIALTIVVNTGLVSHLVEDCYNCAVAHSVCYGLNLIPGLEERYLHGDLVAYGVLVQLILDQMPEQAMEVRELLMSLGIPVTLKQMDVCPDAGMQGRIMKEIVNGPDMEHIPYPVTEEMVRDAMEQVEHL